MRLIHVATVMAALSLCSAVMLYLKVDRLERDLGTARTTSREVRVAADGAAAASDGGRYEAAVRIAEADSRAGGGDAPGGSGSAKGMASARPATIEDRIARLEEQQKVLQAGGGGVPWRGPTQTFAGTVDDLARQLSLTATQRSRIEDAVGRGRQRIEDVLKIPDETGKSPFERRAEARQRLDEAMKSRQPGGFLALATDLTSYQQRKIPGRNDTYGDEIRRIRKETREEIAGALDAKQAEAFSHTNVDGLLGEAGQVSFAYTVGDAGDADQPGMIIEMGSSASTDEAEGDIQEAPASGSR